MSEDYRKESRKDWIAETQKPTVEQLVLGTLQRIADAVEAMAQNWQRLTDDLELYKRWYRQEQEKVAARDRRISALRGQITKLKKKLKSPV